MSLVPRTDEDLEWEVEIIFHNSKHEVVSRLKYERQIFSGSDRIRDRLDPLMMQRLRELSWPGFGLWAGHEPVTKETTFQDVAYQRKADGTMKFDCEDHNCQWRPVLVPVTKTEECVVCFQPNDGNSALACMHMCCCSKCWQKLDRCPLCRKRKIK